ncbi:hypothetical protein EVAR_35774_1 [Eumeta japonica]|uniref:Uncharacterized protein n=1 Tax=Eumeta variegata TaxID=151549 RepID=A0A4C1WR42_EUMVA|nr:hypothetical protein EVAR_35774_1 [Eumeta japonica]
MQYGAARELWGATLHVKLIVYHCVTLKSGSTFQLRLKYELCKDLTNSVSVSRQSPGGRCPLEICRRGGRQLIRPAIVADVALLDVIVPLLWSRSGYGGIGDLKNIQNVEGLFVEDRSFNPSVLTWSVSDRISDSAKNGRSFGRTEIRVFVNYHRASFGELRGRPAPAPPAQSARPCRRRVRIDGDGFDVIIKP